MKEGFRQCMAWLHTWTGLVVGWVLFFIFLTGTAGYVQYELTRWMQPEGALQAKTMPSAVEQFNIVYPWLQQSEKVQNVDKWTINLVNNGRQVSELQASWPAPAKEGEGRGRGGRFAPSEIERFDEVTGEIQPKLAEARETGGGHLLYRMHWRLHYLPDQTAFILVGICTMFMFVAIITGVITHKKIFKDFFTFRSAKGQRSWLDAHNVLSVTSLPFHIMITYSGLVFFLGTYMPLGVPLVYGFGEKGEQQYYAELYPQEDGQFGGGRGGRGSGGRGEGADEKKITVAEQAAKFVDFQPIINKIEQQWGKGEIRSISIQAEKGREPAFIQFNKASSVKLIESYEGETLKFNAFTGQSIAKEPTKIEPAPLKFQNIIFALHEGTFAGPVIRWMYLIVGLLGTAMIATGLVLWTVKRRPKFAKSGGKFTFGHNLVERLNIATVAGLPFAIAIYFWANHLILVAMSGRGAWEVHCMFIAWLLTFIYAVFRPIMQGWREVLLLAALSYMLLPILNFFTTDRHLGMTIPHGDWSLASVDFGFFAFGLILSWASYKVHLKMLAIRNQPVKPVRSKRDIAKTKALVDSEQEKE